MSFWADLIGTTSTTLRIGIAKAILSVTSLTAQRTFTLPDTTGTVVLNTTLGPTITTLIPASLADGDSLLFSDVSDSDNGKSILWSSVKASLGAGYPLMDWGGKNFNGTTTYLDGNAWTGIADSKTGTLFIAVRFANSATAQEFLVHSTGTRFAVVRNANGSIQVQATNAAGAVILNFSSGVGVASAAGTYVVLASWDLATAGTGRMYVNDVSAYSEATYTNDTIDYTVAENSIGATVAGASFFTGDFYTLWFDPTQRLELNTESVRRRFTDGLLVSVGLGRNGELVTGSAPAVFHAYDKSLNWPRNRGSLQATSYVSNGAVANVTTSRNGAWIPPDALSRPVVISASPYTVQEYDNLLINNVGATLTVTYPAASGCPGRVIRNLNTGGAFALNSASSNIIPKAGGAAGTAVLAATDGVWNTLESIGSNWQISQAGT
jgi:hypothetical protein